MKVLPPPVMCVFPSSTVYAATKIGAENHARRGSQSVFQRSSRN
jgi:hypothetical protein